jgi:chromosome segregation ATPase
LFGRLFRRPAANVEEHPPKKAHSRAAKAHKEEPKNIRAQMGALNSVHASTNAFAHASPNSRVGLLAAYAEARTAATADIAALNAEIEALEGELAALVEDPNADPEAIEALEADIAEKEQAIADIDASVLAALEAAANKPVTPEVQAEVDAILAEKGLIPDDDEEVDEAVQAAAAEEGPQDEESAEEGSPNIRAQMGALNSVHASTNAFAHASPNSRVGLLAAYAEARAAAAADIAALSAEIEALEAELAALQEDPNADPEAIEAVEAEITDKQDAIADIDASVLAALEAAANKPVTPEVQAEVDAVLAAKGLIPVEGEGSEEESP